MRMQMSPAWMIQACVHVCMCVRARYYPQEWATVSLSPRLVIFSRAETLQHRNHFNGLLEASSCLEKLQTVWHPFCMTAVHWAAVSLRNQPESGMYKQSCSGNSLSSFCCCIHQHDLKEEPKMRSSELSSFFRVKVGSETHCRVGTGTDASGYTASKGIKTL